jgi:hypothetical protein
MSRHPGDRRGHKDLQLCRQVYDALSYALALLDDPLIEELVLAQVVPAPSASRVEITLVPSRDGLDLDEALARLAAVQPHLRAEVASEIHRKRVPELVFRIVHPTQLADPATS